MCTKSRKYVFVENKHLGAPSKTLIYTRSVAMTTRSKIGYSCIFSFVSGIANMPVQLSISEISVVKWMLLDPSWTPMDVIAFLEHAKHE